MLRTQFTPLNIANLGLWLDATVSSSLWDSVTGGSASTDGGAVMRWEDLSGNANHYTQAANTVNNAPLRKVADSNTANKDSVLFDGSNDVLTATSNVAMSGGATLFCVHKKQANTNDSAIHGFRGATTNNHHPYSDGNFYESFAAATRQSWSQAYSSNRRLYSIIAGSSSWVAYMNGTAVYTAGTVPTLANQNLTQCIGKGSTSGSATNYANIYICELVVYARTLSAAEHTQVVTYLKRKWSL